MNDLLVVERFPSIQGEGVHIGQYAYFIRLGGCNLRCPWCDTTKALAVCSDDAVSFKDLKDDIRKVGFPNLVITGGEPLLQAAFVIKFLRGLSEQLHITVETNGTVECPRGMERINLWSISPKLGLRSYPWEKFEANISTYPWNKLQLKVVVGALPNDVNGWFAPFLSATKSLHNANIPLILQPDGFYYREGVPNFYTMHMRDMYEAVLKTPLIRMFDVRILPQLHVLMEVR